MKSLTQILKDGEITPFTLAGDTVLSPERSYDFIKTITDKSELLKHVKVIRTSKMSKELNVDYLMDNTLYRLKEGSGPSKLTDLEVKHVKLQNLRVDLDVGILASTLEDNRDNPHFEKEKFDEFAMNFSNNLANLGINGEFEVVNNVLDGFTTFLKLNKGYLKILQDSDRSIKLTSDTSILKSLKAVAGALPAEIYNEAVILVNPMDLAALQAEVGEKNGGLAILLNGGAKSILGIPVMPISYMPRNTYLATSLNNLLFSYGSDIAVKRWYDNEKEVLRYRFSLYCDYQIALPEWAVLSSAATTAP